MKNKLVIIAAFILGILVSYSVVAIADTYINSNEVYYDNEASGGTYTNVKESIDELYNLASQDAPVLSGTAVAEDVKSGKTFYNTSGSIQTGTLETQIWEYSSAVSGTGNLFTCGITGTLYATVITSRNMEFSDSHTNDFGVYTSAIKLNGTTIADSTKSSAYVPVANSKNTAYKRFVFSGLRVNAGDVFSYTQTNQNGKNNPCALVEAIIIPDGITKQ